jgi:hypothetical protein
MKWFKNLSRNRKPDKFWEWKDKDCYVCSNKTCFGNADKLCFNTRDQFQRGKCSKGLKKGENICV